MKRIIAEFQPKTAEPVVSVESCQRWNRECQASNDQAWLLGDNYHLDCRICSLDKPAGIRERLIDESPPVPYNTHDRLEPTHDEVKRKGKLKEGYALRGSVFPISDEPLNLASTVKSESETLYEAHHDGYK
jgi:hypothetical protein